MTSSKVRSEIEEVNIIMKKVVTQLKAITESNTFAHEEKYFFTPARYNLNMKSNRILTFINISIIINSELW